MGEKNIRKISNLKFEIWNLKFKIRLFKISNIYIYKVSFSISCIIESISDKKHKRESS